MQVVVISDPELAGQVLDRSRTPHQIDKPHEPMFYHVVDEVGHPLTQHVQSVRSNWTVQDIDVPGPLLHLGS